jgi:hypothetical protein
MYFSFVAVAVAVAAAAVVVVVRRTFFWQTKENVFSLQRDPEVNAHFRAVPGYRLYHNSS